MFRCLQKDITCGVVLEANRVIIKNHTTIVITTKVLNWQKIMMQLRNMMNTLKTQWLVRSIIHWWLIAYGVRTLMLLKPRVVGSLCSSSLCHLYPNPLLWIRKILAILPSHCDPWQTPSLLPLPRMLFLLPPLMFLRHLTLSRVTPLWWLVHRYNPNSRWSHLLWAAILQFFSTSSPTLALTPSPIASVVMPSLGLTWT